MAGFIMATFAATAAFPHPTLEQFHKELRVEIVEEIPSAEKTCRVYLIYSGDTDYLKTGQLQGWELVDLNESGREQIRLAAQQFIGADISAIYASSIPSAQESAEILKKELNLQTEVIAYPELRGECHGEYDGYTKEQYSKERHFQEYKSLSPIDQIFFTCGEGEKNGNKAESKADVARRAIPKIKEIASRHLGKDIIIVTHRGLFTLFNLHMQMQAGRDKSVNVPNGTAMLIEANADTVYLIPSKNTIE